LLWSEGKYHSICFSRRRSRNNAPPYSSPYLARYTSDSAYIKGTRAQIATELTVALGFLAAALAGLSVIPWIVPVAYAAHGIWDYVQSSDR
jgi:hypothetical protein